VQEQRGSELADRPAAAQRRAEQHGRFGVSRLAFEQLRVLAQHRQATLQAPFPGDDVQGRHELLDRALADHQIGPGVVEALPVVLGGQDRERHRRRASLLDRALARRATAATGWNRRPAVAPAGRTNLPTMAAPSRRCGPAARARE
jgi:hypothetical protein